MNIYNNILKAKKNRNKLFTILIDPDKHTENSLLLIVKEANKFKVDYFFVGGSLLTKDSLNSCIKTIKEHSNIDIILFPGNEMQINDNANGILFLSLISGRNAEMLIGKQVISAPIIKDSKLESISTGYILIDSGQPTTASYMSNSTPIPYNNSDIAVCTAMAGEMLGLKLIFMDGGSGAQKSISSEMIKKVSCRIDIPLIIGGGISSINEAAEKLNAGADMIVVGNAIEKNINLIREIDSIMKSKKLI